MDGPILKKAFCCRLERFGLVIGCIQLGISAVVGIIYLVALVCARFEVNILDMSNPSAAGSLMVTSSLISLLTSGMLVYGIKRERHQFMLPWLILSVIILTVYIIVGVFWFFFYLSRPGAEYAFYSFVTLVLLAAQGLGIYITLAIYSLYYQIKQSSKPLQNSA